MGKGQCLLNVKPKILEPALHSLWMEIKVELHELNRVQRERTPGLPAEEIAKDRLEIQLIRKLEDKHSARSQHIFYLSQRFRRIRHVMKNTDHRRSIEQAIHKRQAIYISRHIDISIGSSQPLLGLLELGPRIIQQDDPVEAEVARRISPGTRAKLQQEMPFLGKEPLQSYGLRAVFIVAPTFPPEGSLIVGVFVVANRRGSQKLFPVQSTSNGTIGKSHFLHQCRVINIATIINNRRAEQSFELFEVQLFEFIPFGDHN